MIAQPLPYEERPARPAGTRAGRGAVRRRRARTHRERYRGLARVVGCIAVLAVVVVVYLGLMANVTRMNYELATLEQTRTTLLERTEANDDAIASASSSERLKASARRLGMHEPQRFAAVSLPPEPEAPAPHGIAFLGWLK